jgi:hypothetical protein
VANIVVGGNSLAKCLVRLADGNFGPPGRLKTAKMPFANRPDSNYQNAFHHRQSLSMDKQAAKSRPVCDARQVNSTGGQDRLTQRSLPAWIAELRGAP